MTMEVAGVVYIIVIVLVIWAGSRRLGSRWFYVITSGAASIAGALAIILTPSSEITGLEPRSTWSPLLGGGGWIGGGLLLLGVAALAASLLYRGPSADVPEELDS